MSEDDEKQQEILYKLNLYEQYLNQIRQQFQAVEEGVIELKSLNLGLDDLKNFGGKEILAPIGRGIFVKAELISKDLIVDLGNKNIVKKSVPETKKIINDQIKKLDTLKEELDEKMREIEEEATKFLMEMQKKQ